MSTFIDPHVLLVFSTALCYPLKDKWAVTLDIVNRMTRRLRRQATLRTLAFVARDAKTSASLYFS